MIRTNNHMTRRKVVASRSGDRKVVPIYIHTKGEKEGRNMPQGMRVNAANGNVFEGTMEIRSPLVTPEAMYSPQGQRMRNAFIRYYYEKHSIVGNCIDLHATLPFSNPRFGGIEDKQIANFYDWTKEDVLHLYEWILSSAQEYTLMGEQFSFGTFSPSLGTFDSLTVLNPDLLDVFAVDFGRSSSRKFIVSMKIPDELRKLYQRSQNDERFRTVFNALLPEIQQCVISGQDIPLDPNNMFAMQRLAAPYAQRGTSLVVRALDDLMYETKLRTAQMAAADGNISPKQLWKLGNIAGGYMPTPEDIDSFNQLLSQGEHRDFFQIVTHEAVNYQSIVPSAGMIDIAAQFDLCQKRILIALHTADAWLGGEGPSFSNSVVALKVLKGRYKVALSRYEQIINDMNRKIAIANGFRKRTKAELDHNVRTSVGALIIPEISWPNNLGFNENYDRTQILIQLAEKHKISYKTLLDELGVDEHEEKERLKKEMESPLADGYYEARVQQLLDAADAIKNGGKSFGIGKDKVAPALSAPSSGGKAPSEAKPEVRENPENMAIPTGGQEMLDSV